MQNSQKAVRVLVLLTSPHFFLQQEDKSRHSSLQLQTGNHPDAQTTHRCEGLLADWLSRRMEASPLTSGLPTGS